MHQSRKLLSLGLFILAQCSTDFGNKIFVALTSLSMRFIVTLTEVKGWKYTTNNNYDAANVQVCKLIQFIGSKDSMVYFYIRRFVCRLDVLSSSQEKNSIQADEIFVITATALTLALRPFHIADSIGKSRSSVEVQSIADIFLVYILTIPWLTKRLPTILLPALKHKSVVSPCLKSLLVRFYQKCRAFNVFTPLSSKI